MDHSNRLLQTQDDLAETYGVSRSFISKLITAYDVSPVIRRVDGRGGQPALYDAVKIGQCVRVMFGAKKSMAQQRVAEWQDRIESTDRIVISLRRARAAAEAEMRGGKE